jgi:hypothetical protein
MFALPATRRDGPPVQGAAEPEILWTPDDYLPTGGFPVQPRRAA